jgi:hypothetical protein
MGSLNNNNTTTWRISLTENERKMNVARFYKAMEYINDKLTQTDQQQNLEKAKMWEIEYFEQASSKICYYQLSADRVNSLKLKLQREIESKNILFNIHDNLEENEKHWYERRTKEEINENFIYRGNVKVVNNNYLDVFFEVPEKYWLEYINKHNNNKIINEELYGHILEKEYTEMIYYSYYIVKRYFTQ